MEPIQSGAAVDEIRGESPERVEARRRVQGRRDFSSHVAAYIVINAFFIGIWAVTGSGYFWPAWVLGCWGAGLILHAWDVFLKRPVTEADIDAELQHGDGRR